MFDLEIVVDAQLPPYHLLVTLGALDPEALGAIPITVTVSPAVDANVLVALAAPIAEAIVDAVAKDRPEDSVWTRAAEIWAQGGTPDATQGGAISDDTRRVLERAREMWDEGTAEEQRRREEES